MTDQDNEAIIREFFRPWGGSSLLLFVLAALVASFLVWARYAVLDEVTRAQGRVVPARRTQVIQNLEGGIILQMLAREGETVEAGQVLLRIDSTIADAQYRKSRAEYLALLGQIARRRAEAAGQEPDFPPELVAEAPEVVANERKLFQARRMELATELEIFDRQVFQRQQELAELEAKLAGQKKSRDLLGQELAMNRPLADSGAVPRTEILQLERSLTNIESEIEAATLAVPRVRAALKEATERLAGRRMKFGGEALAAISDLEGRLAGLKPAASAERDRVRRTEVASPVKGVVKQIRFATEGAIIKPGEPIMEIVPADDALLVEAWVQPRDVAFLRPGMAGQVRVTAYDSAIYGALAATLEEISADTFAAENGATLYRIQLRTSGNSLTNAGQRIAIIPGMTAEVDIVTGSKTVLSYLMKPILKARQVALTER